MSESMPPAPDNNQNPRPKAGKIRRYETALTLIALGGCETFYSDTMTCRSSGSGRARDGYYGADRWCQPCIAADALDLSGGDA